MNDKAYSVCLWLTHPDNENDDCCTGLDFDTLVEAQGCASNLDNHFDMSYFRDCAFIEIDGPDHHSVIERPGVLRRAVREAAADMAAERTERAMQAGMGLGIQAYNEEMGYD